MRINMAAKSIKRKLVVEMDNYSSDDENEMNNFDSDDSEYSAAMNASRSSKRQTKRFKSPSLAKPNKNSNNNNNNSDEDEIEEEEEEEEDYDLEFRNVSPSPSMETVKSVQRRPTRKPNPKISNRNALMARENRRKKKEYLESLQRNVHETQTENKKLKKLLRERNDTISKLTNESLYLRSVLANKTEIMSLLKTIQGNRIPITSSTMSFVTEPLEAQHQQQYNEITSQSKRFDSYASSSGCSPNSVSTMSPPGHHDDDDISNVDNDKENDLNDLFTDTAFKSNELQWENLLNDSAPLKSELTNFEIADLRDIDDNEIISTNHNNNNVVKNEHNYFNNPITNKVANATERRLTAKKSPPGICLHLSSGRVSLEFCSTCHQNSENAWIEEI